MAKTKKPAAKAAPAFPPKAAKPGKAAPKKANAAPMPGKPKGFSGF